MRRLALLLVALLWMQSGTAALAQQRAALIADSISVVGDELRAEGHVEVLYKGQRLRASAITYNRARDKITIEGPMSLSDGPDFIVIADAGELDADFQNGILLSARLVLDQQLQVAAAELERVDGRYTQLFRAVASTCPVCSTSDVPLWQIRASRAIHDQETKRMYYYDAVFEVAGLPVFYVPRLRMPDASVSRAAGFLLPKLSTSSVLGSGVQIPYFIAINDQADVTLTAFTTPKTKTLGFDYRQLFRTGAIGFTGAVSDDQLIQDYLRGYLFARGVFFLPRDFELSFDAELSSDDSYLSDYGISRKDRLRSDLGLTRVRRSSYTAATATQFVSFRADEQASTTPSFVAQVDQIKTFRPPLAGGQASYWFQGVALTRSSNEDVLGRDYMRLSAGLEWTRSAVFGPGFLLQGAANAALDAYDISQDSTAPNQTNLTTTGGVALSWPQARTLHGGAREIFDPKIQLVFSDAATSNVPNEESTLVEFDEGSLWAIDRLPGSSAYETGTRVNAGATWTHQDPSGWTAGLTLGRVFRLSDPGQFNPASGLSGDASDWLVAAQFNYGSSFSAMSRLLLDGDLALNRNDTRLSWTHEKISVDASFLWQIAEPEVGRDQDTWELHTGAGFPLARNWRAAADVRYDFIAGRAAAAALDLIYEGPCITMDIGASRTFTSSEAVEPQTAVKISLSVPQGSVASSRPKLQCGG